MIEKIRYDKRARREFLDLNRDVIKQWTAETVGHSVIYGWSDELSYAIVAFNEAIDRFNGSGDFYAYAKSYVRQKLYVYAPVNRSKKELKKI